MNHPDIITISVEKRAEIEADRADLRVTISGASLVTNRAAQNKAREIRDLAAALAPLGIEDTQIKLQSVRLETASGAILKTSTATYVLQINDVGIDVLADVLGALASQKNLRQDGISWRYSTEEATREKLLDECLREARAKATRIAAPLGVRLLGVHELSEYSQGVVQERGVGRMDFMEAPGLQRKRQMSADDFGVALSHSKEVRNGVTIQFRVSEMQSEVSRDDA